MNWHEPTADEANGNGAYVYLVDISPDSVPHQAASDGDALFRIAKPGWSWLIRREIVSRKGHRDGWQFVGGDVADTKEAALGDAMSALARLRES